MGKRGFASGVMLEVMASKWDREMYFKECAKLASKRTIKYLLKRIIKVAYK